MTAPAQGSLDWRQNHRVVDWTWPAVQEEYGRKRGKPLRPKRVPRSRGEVGVREMRTKLMSRALPYKGFTVAGACEGR